MKLSLLLITLLVSLWNCSSVQKVEPPKSRLQEPYYKLQQTDDASDIKLLQKSDYKVRYVGHNRPKILVRPILPAGENQSENLNYISEEVVLLWTHTKADLVFLEESVFQSDDKLQSACRKNEIDAILQTDVVSDGDSWNIRQSLVDPVTGENYGEISYGFGSGVQEEESYNQVLFSKNQKTVIPIAKREFQKPIWKEKPSDYVLEEQLQKTIFGTLSVISTSTDTEIVLDKKDLGKVPIRELPVREGMHVIQLRKPGKDPVAKQILVRAGQDARVLHQWDDDLEAGSLNLLSYPEGLNVSIDGFVEGKTPFFRSNMISGSYGVELIQEGKEKSLVYYEGSAAVEPNRITELALPFRSGNLLNQMEFWKPSGEEDFSGLTGERVEFRAPKSMPAGWNGVFSVPIVPDSSVVSAILPKTYDSGSGVLAFSIHSRDAVITLAIEKGVVSVYTFPSDGTAMSSYRFKEKAPEEGWSLRFEADKKDQIMRVYLGNSKVYEGKWTFSSPWQLSILTRGESVQEGSPFSDLHIEYLGYK